MNSILIQLSALLSVVVLTACTSTSNSVARVDSVKRKMELQSTSDENSSMPKPAEQAFVQKAEDLLATKVARKKGNLETLLNLAQVYLVEEKLTLAEKTCRQALKIDLKNQEARKILAQIYFRKGNSDMAAIILNGIGGGKSKDAAVLNLMGMIAIKENRNAEALDYFNAAIKADAADIAARMNLGVLYVHYKQLPQASIQFERVLKLMPTHNDAKLHLAIIKASRGDLTAAAAIYKEILDHQDDNPLALYNLAVLEKNRKNYDESIKILKKYLATRQARKAKNTDVFALIDDIRHKQEIQASRAVSDEEIQKMAAKEQKHEVAARAQDDDVPASTNQDEEVDQLEKAIE